MRFKPAFIARFKRVMPRLKNRFTAQFKRVGPLTWAEASRLRSNSVGTEHLVLAVMLAGHGTAVAILRKLGLDLDQLRRSLEEVASASAGPLTVGKGPLTPQAQRVLELATHEADSRKAPLVGTEHLLLAVTCERQDATAQVLAMHGINYEKLKAEIGSLELSEEQS